MKPKTKKIIAFGVIILFIVSLFLLKNGIENSDPDADINLSEPSEVQFEPLPEISTLEALPYKSNDTSVMAVGDFLLDRNVGRRMKELNDYHFPVRNTKYLLEAADITFANVECPVCEGREIGYTERSFRADPETVEALVYGGFDIVSLANNHTMNFGGNCLIDTFGYLNDAGIDYVGAGANVNDACAPLTTEINNTKLAFLAYNDSDVVPDYYFASEEAAGTCRMDNENVKKDIKRIKDGEYGEVDLILISMHSGTEYTPVPNYRQINFSKSAIDAGADIILGHHPHHTQHIDQYKGKYIIYSMGNFVLDQMSCNDCTKELLVNLSILDKQIKEVEIIPIRQKNFCETFVAEGAEKEEILNIINFETTEKPYLSFENDSYQIRYRDVLVDKFEDENSKTESESKDFLYSWKVGENDLKIADYENSVYVIKDDHIIWHKDFENDLYEVELMTVQSSTELAIMTNNGNTWQLETFSYDNGKISDSIRYNSEDTQPLEVVSMDSNSDGNDELITLIKSDSGNFIKVYAIEDNDLKNVFESQPLKITNIWQSRKKVFAS